MRHNLKNCVLTDGSPRIHRFDTRHGGFLASVGNYMFYYSVRKSRLRTKWYQVHLWWWFSCSSTTNHTRTIKWMIVNHPERFNRISITIQRNIDLQFKNVELQRYLLVRDLNVYRNTSSSGLSLNKSTFQHDKLIFPSYVPTTITLHMHVVSVHNLQSHVTMLI